MRRNRLANASRERHVRAAFFTVGTTVKTVIRGCRIFATRSPATYKFLGKSRDVRSSDGLCAQGAQRPSKRARGPAAAPAATATESRMESNTPTTSNAGLPAESTAETLRALQERAQAALAAQRARMGQLETQLTAQLDSISAAISDQLSTQAVEGQRADQSSSQIAQLQYELDETKAAWARERQQLAADHANRSQLLEKQRAELEVRADELTISRRDLESRQQALDDRATQLNGQERELRHLQDDIEGRAQESARQQSQITALENDLQNRESELARRETSWQSERAAIEAERASLIEQLATLKNNNLAQGGELATQLADARRELAALQIDLESQHARQENERLAFQTELSALAEERDALAAQLANSTDQGQSASAQVASQLTDFQEQFDLQHTAWEAERRQLNGEREALQQKFDLLLADMQRQRGRVAELEQELASRPEPDQSESVDLVRLRGERDALAQRVEELEQQPEAVVDSDTAQQIADLQRRFELAVEDVRDLKKRNTQLEAEFEAQAAAAKAAAPAAASAAGGNWEAVKKRLLASLEGETAAAGSSREKEIATIENTVHITDEIVANKDRQLAELRMQLASGLGSTDGVSQAASDLNDAINADEAIQKHRARIADLEREMEGKLRETEMQLSLERAKIAREQSQLTELRIELESMRGPNGPKADAGTGNSPKRRWLSKLGLGEDEK
jgi:chromosome segregation ATPase